MEKERIHFDTRKLFEFMSATNKLLLGSKELLEAFILQKNHVSLRMLQKWAEKNSVKYNRVHGRKYYLWNKKNITELANWINRERKKPKDYYIKVDKKPKPEKPRKEEINFITIKKFVAEIYDNHKMKNDENSLIRDIERYCKEKKIQTEYHFGRKYYVLNKKIIAEILKEFKWGWDKYYENRETFSRQKKRKNRLKENNGNSKSSFSKNSYKILRKIAKEECNIKGWWERPRL